MSYTDQRNRLRAVLGGSQCVSPASVFDAISARVAEFVGHQIGVMPGSDASAAELAAPNIVLLTLTEFVEQARRILRVSRLSIFADADHGYGNALNVMRTVQEFEHAGIAGLCIEDALLPTPFGPGTGKPVLISIEEAVGKLRAALDARSDPALVVAARTIALRGEGMEATLVRAKAYAATGVDALFLVGCKTLKELEAVRSAVDLPIILGSTPDELKREDLAARGARLMLRGHHEPLAGVIKVLHDIYGHLYADGPPAALKERVATQELKDQVLRKKAYREWQDKYLR